MHRNRTQRSLIVPVIVLAAVLTGCSGADGPATLTAPVDTAPPAVPQGLAAAGEHADVKLVWEPNTLDADLVGYHVYRLAFEQAWPLTDEPVTTHGFRDTSPREGTNHYAVTAVDRAGNESAWTTVTFDAEERMRADSVALPEPVTGR